MCSSEVIWFPARSKKILDDELIRSHKFSCRDQKYLGWCVDQKSHASCEDSDHFKTWHLFNSYHAEFDFNVTNQPVLPCWGIWICKFGLGLDAKAPVVVVVAVVVDADDDVGDGVVCSAALAPGTVGKGLEGWKS